jgi:hypothetical protein
MNKHNDKSSVYSGDPTTRLGSQEEVSDHHVKVKSLLKKIK